MNFGKIPLLLHSKKTRPLPDFLGIGSQRTGSTWLYKHLESHPEIWMPPIKEIHYFDILNKENAERRREKLYQDYKKRVQVYQTCWFSKKKMRVLGPPNLLWDINYFLRSPSQKWYNSLFLLGANKVTGEITPAYMTLDQEVVEAIYAHNPNTKIIFFMRDPIERVWSAAVKHLAKLRRRNAKKVPEAEFIQFFQSNGTHMRTNYLRSLSIWESVFPPEQIYIDFFDNIQENPREVLLRVFEFLGVEARTDFISEDLSKKIGTTDRFRIEIPSDFEILIAEKYIDQLEMLNQRFGGHTDKWLARAKKILHKS